MENTSTKQNKWLFYNSTEYTNHQWYKYAHGYKQSALILIQHAEDANSYFEIEDLIFPIFYLFRHFTELLLKQIIIEYADFKGIKNKLPITHELGKLWADVEPIINDLYFENAKKYSQEVKILCLKKDVIKKKTVITKLHNLDRTSNFFRYPVSKSGKKSLKNDVKEPLATLKREIDETFSFLAEVSFTMFLFKHSQ